MLTSPPVHVVNVVPTLLCGGTEHQVMTLSRALDPSRFTLEFACLRRWGPFVDELTARGVGLTEYPVRSFYRTSALTQQARFAGHLIRRRVDIVHAYSFYGNVFAVLPARAARTRVVIASIRDCGAYLTPLQRRVQRYVCRLADCVLVNATAVKDWLVADGYDAARIRVIHNGVDLARFAAYANPDQIRDELGVPRGAPLVAVVSRLTRMKGLEQFLEACAMVSRDIPDARFLVVGGTPPHDPAYLDELREVARRAGIDRHVVFTGFRSDIPALLASVSAAVMPSLNEALSNSLLEAMAAGAPVVATRVGGTPEALIDGDTGLLVPPASVPELADAVRRLLRDRDLALRLGHAARRLIEERFSIARMVSATEALYEELLARRQPIDLRRHVQVAPPAPVEDAASKSEAVNTW